MIKYLLTLFLMTLSTIYPNEYYVNTQSGLIVRAEPSQKAPKLGHLKHLTRFKVSQLGQTETINGREGPWLQIKFKEKNAWVFGGFASTNRPEIGGQSLPLSTFLNSNIEFQLNVSNAVKGENPHGFAFIQKKYGPPDTLQQFTCELPLSGGNDGYECIQVIKASAAKDVIEFTLSGRKCLEVPQDPTDLCRKFSTPVQVICAIDRNLVEASYKETGLIQGNIRKCKSQ